MRRIHTLAVALVAALSLYGAPAAAQDRPVEFDSFVIPGWTFTPSIGLSGLWDSNVAVAGNQAEGRSTESDRVFMITPQGQLDFRSARTEFIAGYRGDLRRYVSAEALNGFDQRAYVSLRHAATPRVQLFARTDFDDVASTDEIDLNGIPFARYGARTNRFSAGTEVRLTKLTDASVQYENVWVSFDNQANFLRGGVMHGVRAEYTARLSERTRVGGELRVRQSNLNDDTRVLWFQDTGAILERALSPHVHLALAGGYSLVRDPGASGNRGGLYLRSELTRAVERATLGVGYERSYAPSFGFGGSSGSQELRGFVHMPFTRNRTYVNAAGMWRRTNPLLAEELALDSFIVDTTVGYGLSRSLRFEAFHRYSRQDSRITGGEINRHRAGVQVVISQPMRIQ
jgi:hypothetical protein